jgi:hypothetical protein
MKKTISKFAILSIIFTLALSVNFIFAAWIGPTAPPPDNNTPLPLNVGPTDQIKNGGLGLNKLSVFGPGYFQNNLGVGITNPEQKLEVVGGVKVGEATVCTDGTIRYSDNDFQGCKAGSWVSLTEGGSGGGSGTILSGSLCGAYFTGCGGVPSRNYQCGGMNVNSGCPSGYSKKQISQSSWYGVCDAQLYSCIKE